MIQTNTWLTSDWHLQHRKMEALENRPSNFEDLIIANHAKLIQPKDTLVNFGDVIFANRSFLRLYLKAIDCRCKILVRGNHDEHITDTWFVNNGFDIVCDSITINGVIMSHAPLKLTDDARLNVHGHFHSGAHRQDEEWYPYYSDRHVLLGLENTHYNPVTLKDVINGRYTKKIDGRNIIVR